MKTEKKLLGLVGLAVMGVLLSIGSAQAQKAVEWKMLAGWTKDYYAVRLVLTPFVQEVNQRTRGRLKISWLGPEAVPPFEQLKPVREGLFDALFTSTAYHAGEVAAGMSLDYFPSTGKERRDSGIIKIMDELYRKRANVVCLGAIPGGVGYHLLLKKKINNADLTGLKIRTSPFYDPLIKALHGATVRIEGGEIYSALEKGVVDGTTWPAIGALDFKWYEVVKYMVRPRFGENGYVMVVNLNSWNKLPKDLQEIFTEIVIETENKSRPILQKELEYEEKELQKKGMEMLVLPPEEAAKYIKVFYDSSWTELIKRDSEFGPRLKEVADQIIRKQLGGK
jgi:TRAP-type C4-dicarboxylate transport system substrate-binding protein